MLRFGNHLVLLIDRFLRKMPLKRAITRRLFIAKLNAQNILLLDLKVILGF